MYTLANMLTILRNGQLSKKGSVVVRASKLNQAVLSVIKATGYIENVEVTKSEEGHDQLKVYLKYFDGRPVMDLIRCVSKPSLRRYNGAQELPVVMGGLGIAVISTSQGVMTANEARKRGLGGEVLAFIG